MALISMRAGFRLQGLRRLMDGRRQSAAMRLAVSDIAALISRSTLVRFDRFSKGGGDWPEIKPATAKRKGNKRILFHFGDLRRALAVGFRPQVQWNGSWMSIRASMKSTARHKRARMPVQKLMNIHDRGLGHNPRRRVLGKLDNITRMRAQQRLQRAMRGR